MSGTGFHVHGPHDHHVEHAAQHEPEGMAGKIAVMTAIMATVGALFAYQGGSTQANAGLFKNNAAIKKTEASNQWNYYQAKSNKQNLAELALTIAPSEKSDFYKKEIERYKEEKEVIRKDAEKLEKESTDWDKKSEAELHLHHRWAQAMTAIQIAISLAAITLLTKKKWLEWGSYAMAGVGVMLAMLAIAHV